MRPDGNGAAAMTQVTESERTARPRPAPAHRYDRDSVEFGRVLNLSDGVFAIALTLLVLTLDSLDVVALVTFALAFFLVANVWWQHHRIFAQLAWIEPSLIAINLGLLAGVALVPFPTSLVGADPRSQAAVLPFLGLFAALSVLSIATILRAQRLAAWRRPLPVRLFRWVLADWGTNLVLLIGCLVVAVLAPLPSLGLLVAGSTVHALATARVGPSQRRTWF
jgi:uncharacterized membrane protein